MKLKTLLLAVSAAAVLATAAAPATADPIDRGMRHDERMDRRMDRRDDRSEVRHDRYWRDGYHGFVDRDRVFVTLRAHHFTRFVGDPYWFHDRYVVKTYDRFGRVVFVEINPYTGDFIGVVRF